MKASELAAVEVAKKMGVVKEGQAFDPSIILTLAPIIVELIGMLQECRKTPEQALRSVKNPTLWQKFAVRREVRRSMSLREYHKHGDRFVDAVFAAAKDTDVQTIQALYEEA